MEKPKFPKARLIREDFLPYKNTMNNFRVRKVQINEDITHYYPEERTWLFFWTPLVHVQKWFGIETCLYKGPYICHSYEDALEIIHNVIKERKYPKVDYLEVPPSCDFNCQHSNE